MEIEELDPKALQQHNDPLETLPALPQHMQEHRSKSTSQVLDELNSSPIFMTSLVENEATEALRALAYEGEAAEVAENFKEQGNECFKASRWSDAKEFYGKAIDVLEGKKRERHNENSAGMDTEEIQKEMRLLEACMLNRAACHLELRNYRSCTQDCAGALRINPTNVKAFYRSSRALLALGKIMEADDTCARGLTIEPENKALRVVAEDIVKKSKEAEAKVEKERAKMQREGKEKWTLAAALKARAIRTRRTEQPPEMEDARVQLLPDPVDPASELSFPAVLLYPLHMESDFIKMFQETQTLGSHLEYILPLPWDKQDEYTLQTVDGYIETIEGGLIKIGKNVSLLQILASAKVEVVDEVVRIFVVPRAKADDWIRDFKLRNAADKVK